MSTEAVGPSVRVFVWHGSSSKNLGMGSFVPSFGHVALETRVDGVVRYISFWPGNCNTEICRRKAPHYHSLDTDRNYEERPPDVPPYVLKNLDVDKINAWYDTHKEDLSWVHHGSCSILKGPDEYNCAGLTFRLLEEGGIRRTVPNRPTQNVKRSIGAIFSSCAVFAALCYWSSYTIRPLSQLPRIYSEFSIRATAAADLVFRDVYALKDIYGHISNAESALKNVYRLELGNDPRLRSHLSEFVEQINPHFMSSIFASAQIDPSLETRSLTIRETLLTDFTKYSPFLTLGGVASLSTLALGVGMAFFNHKVVVDVITPADVEELVVCAVNKEQEQLNGRKFSILSMPLTWVACALGVACIGHYFFQETLSFKKTLTDLLLNKVYF